VYLEVNGQLLNISQQHWLLCIEPVVFGIWIEKQAHKVALQNATTCKLYFNSLNQDKGLLAGSMEAVLNFTRMQAIEEETGTLFLLKLEKSYIHQLNALKRYLIFRRYYKKNGLTFPQFKSFVAAYSYPRRIRVISFRQDDYYNIFPMDLLGDISGNNRFVFGLRHSNVALDKIITTRKLVVSEAPYAQKDTIYRLGAHHSSVPPQLDALPFRVITSKKHGFYVPEWALSYREIDVLQTINLGSHMLIWGSTAEEQVLRPSTGYLYLIHFLHHLYQQEHGISYPST
ncbi:MAG: hypothetical protein J7621_30290, partial [Niastella sp.]|nr:hypothetical protein [Niastella sp.]